MKTLKSLGLLLLVVLVTLAIPVVQVPGPSSGILVAIGAALFARAAASRVIGRRKLTNVRMASADRT